MKQQLNYIDPRAELGKAVEVGPFSVIEEDVVIGDGTWIGPHVTIMAGTRIGRYCQIFPGAVVGTIPQDLKFKGEPTLVNIGDYTTIREYVTISRSTKPDCPTIIGNHVLLMAYVHVGHDCAIGDYCILSNTVQLAGYVHIDSYANLGGKVAVKQFVRIGSYTMIAGGSLVRKDVPPYIKVAREPLKYCGLNLVGLRRHGFTLAQMQLLKQSYHYIFQQGLPLTEALNRINQNIPPSSEKETIINFIQQSERGIVKGA
jgi:UDP-N-acetylglucosamine acyltransferase